MANLVSAWTEGDYVRLVQRDDSGSRVIRSLPARWSLFVTGLDDSDRAALARDSRIVGVKAEGKYTRIDCKNRWARKDIVDVMEKAALRAGPHVEVLEGDVSPVRRLLSDVGSLEVSDAPKLGFFDLETDSRKTFNEARDGKARVLSWCVTGGDGSSVEAVLEEDTDEAELRLLQAFFAAVDPFDCLLAWNGDGFDFLVLEKRTEKLRMSIQLQRWTWLDHLEVFKKYNMHSDDSGEAKQSFKLDHVATYLLGEGKQEFDAAKTWEAWEAGGERRASLLRYNVQDTKLLPRIEEKTGFIALHLATCHVCRVFPDSQSLNATQQGDGYLLRLGTIHGYRWPTRRRFEEDQIPEKFKGAFVMDPQRLGAIDNVHVCDFAGLYPSIMRTWNMSPDTKVRVPFRAGGNREAAVPAVRDGVCQLPHRSTWFRTDTDGMFRIALDTLVAKRAEYTNEMKKHAPGTTEHARYKRLSGAFKIVANSFYGICGSPWSRFFDVEIAEGVTQTGKWLLENVIREAKSSGMEPFYGDTDSVFVTGTSSENFRALVEGLNADWRNRVRPWGIVDEAPMHIDLDFEKTFRRLVIISAKRYAAKYAVYKGKEAKPDAAPEVKGLEFKRGDTIRLARDMQSEVVKSLLEADDLPTPTALRLVIDRWRDRVLHGDLTLADLTISQALSKRVSEYADRYVMDRCTSARCGYDFGGVDTDGPEKCPKCGEPRGRTAVPAHVRVAKLIQARGEAIGEGARVSYVIVGSDDKIQAIPASDPDALQRADRAYYWERRVYPATARVLEKVYPGETWGESKTDRKQRVIEQAGQTRIDFSGETITRRKKVEAPGAPVRRKKANRGEVVIEMREDVAEASNGTRERVLRAVRATIEAHPGDLPVTIRITVPDEEGRAVVTIPTGMSIAGSEGARSALGRIIKSPDEVKVLGPK